VQFFDAPSLGVVPGDLNRIPKIGDWSGRKQPPLDRSSATPGARFPNVHAVERQRRQPSPVARANRKLDSSCSDQQTGAASGVKAGGCFEAAEDFGAPQGLPQPPPVGERSIVRSSDRNQKLMLDRVAEHSLVIGPAVHLEPRSRLWRVRCQHSFSPHHRSSPKIRLSIRSRTAILLPSGRLRISGPPFLGQQPLDATCVLDHERVHHLKTALTARASYGTRAAESALADLVGDRQRRLVHCHDDDSLAGATARRSLVVGLSDREWFDRFVLNKAKRSFPGRRFRDHSRHHPGRAPGERLGEPDKALGPASIPEPSPAKLLFSPFAS
jgi:hypothetical protein